MAYQSFPWQAGDSRSFEKLISLYLPVLRGKSVLDVGCNTGYFCGWAVFQGASRVKGVDINAEALRQAKKWLPGCEFVQAPWEDLGDETFDVVLCLSAIHYAEDQQALIDGLMRRVAPGGLLVLELGVAPGEAEEFVSVERSIDTRQFPTKAKLHSMLREYAYKAVRPSVSQAGDPIPRVVYHVYHRLPSAVLFLDEPYTGKTNVIERLLKPEVRRLSGDLTLYSLYTGDIDAPDELRGWVRVEPDTGHFNCAGITGAICEQGLLGQLAHVFMELADKQDFVLDHYLPAPYREGFAGYFREGGYYVSRVTTRQGKTEDWTRIHPRHSLYEKYERYLESYGLIDEGAYLEANPDVAQAIETGLMPNAQYHYFHFGQREGRKTGKD